MSEILVFGDREEGLVTTALKSFRSNHVVRNVVTMKATEEEYSKVQCIVLCLHANEVNPTSLDVACNKIKQFLNAAENFDSAIPILPIVYDADQEKHFSLENNLSQLSQNHPTLNLLKNGLIWLESESSDDLKAKMMEPIANPESPPFIAAKQ